MKISLEVNIDEVERIVGKALDNLHATVKALLGK